MDVIYQKNRESRQGIALIMVVGMLALMMVMAVAFAIFMRTERVAAGSFRTDVRARNLLQVALSRAVDAIDASMGTTNYPPWDALYSGGGSYVREALTKNALDQIPLAALTPQGTCVAGAANYVVIAGSVPSGDKGAVINLTDHSFGLITNVVSVGGGNNQVFHTALSGGKNNTWASGVDKYYVLQPAMVDLPPTAGSGRFGYVVINCSGLPDANRVGGGVRSIGTNVTEIQIASLPGVNEPALVSARATPFETHQELIARGMANGVFSGYPDAFVCYSSAVTNSGKVYIGGTVADLLTKRDEIIGALTNLTYQDVTTPSVSFTRLEAETLFTNLIDYVDTDNIPGNLGNLAATGNPEGPCVERVPMANEIVVTNRIEFNLDFSSYPSVTNYIMSGVNIVSVEFMAPVLNSTIMGGFSWSCALEGLSGNALTFPAQGAVFTNGLSYGGSLLPYTVKTVQLKMVGDPVAKPINLTPIVSSYDAKVMTKHAGSTVVDVVTNSGITLSITSVISPSGGLNSDGVRTQYVGIGVAGRECIDPRINGSAGNWISKAITLGTTNLQALIRLDPNTYGTPADKINFGTTSKGKDGDTALYVANAPLQSVGDLGYLFFGSYWETVRLFKLGDNASYGKLHPIIDHFTVDNPADSIPKGRINPNTQNPAVLSACLENMSIAKRHSSSVKTLSPAQLASAITVITNRTAGNAFDSLAELGAVRWDLVEPSWNSLERESVIRNSLGLFDVRQNLFVILLYADVTKKDIANNTATLSSVMGMAEVWRDPLTNSHPVNVHSFQMIESQ